MRVATFVVTVMTVAALLHTSYTSALACSCVVPVENGKLVQAYASFDLIVEGRIAARDSADPVTQLRFDVDTAFRGQAPAQIRLEMGYSVVDQPTPTSGELDSLAPDCKYSIYGGPGERYVLFLSPDNSGAYRPSGCASFPTAKESQYQVYRDLRSAIAALLASPTPASIPVTGGPPLQAESEEHHDDAPLAVIIPLAIIIPLAVLVVFSLIKPRGGGH